MDTILITILALCVPIAVYLMMKLFSTRNQFDAADRTVIITGASQGLGLSLAKLLAAKGAHVVIVAQTISKLEKALETIRDSARSRDTQKFLYLSYDLRSPQSAPDILRKVTDWNNGNPPDVVLNCAGHCIPGFFASSNVETLRDQMETVYWSSAYMSHATLQAWTKPVSKEIQREHQDRPRHLIFTSSVLAFLSVAGYAPYNPAKSAMRALADTLNQEVQVYNGSRSHTEPGPAAEIRIHALYPMGIQSPGFENEQKLKPALTQKLEEDDKPQRPDDLAKIIISELEAGKYAITASFIGHIMRGWATAGSQRVGLADYLWNWLGSIVVLFIVPDHLGKCWRWGKEKGPHSTN